MQSQLNVGDVLGRAFAIYKDQFVVLFGVSLLINLAAALLTLTSDAARIVGALLLIVPSTFYLGMVIRLVDDVRDGRRDASLGNLLAGVAPVFITLLLLSILLFVVLLVAFLLLVVPFLYLLTIWAVAAPTVVLERTGAFEALGRSRQLVRGRGWAVFGVLLLVLVAIVVAAFVGATVAALIGGDIAEFVFNWLFPAFVTPVAAVVSAVLFFALRDGGDPGPDGPEPAWPSEYSPPSAR